MLYSSNKAVDFMSDFIAQSLDPSMKFTYIDQVFRFYEKANDTLWDGVGRFSFETTHLRSDLYLTSSGPYSWSRHFDQISAYFQKSEGDSEHESWHLTWKSVQTGYVALRLFLLRKTAKISKMTSHQTSREQFTPNSFVVAVAVAVAAAVAAVAAGCCCCLWWWRWFCRFVNSKINTLINPLLVVLVLCGIDVVHWSMFLPMLP